MTTKARLWLLAVVLVLGALIAAATPVHAGGVDCGSALSEDVTSQGAAAINGAFRGTPGSDLGLIRANCADARGTRQVVAWVILGLAVVAGGAAATSTRSRQAERAR